MSHVLWFENVYHMLTMSVGSVPTIPTPTTILSIRLFHANFKSSLICNFGQTSWALSQQI